MTIPARKCLRSVPQTKLSHVHFRRWILILLLTIMAALVACAYFLYKYIIRKYRTAGKQIRIRFVQDANNGGGPVSDRKSLLENGTLSPGVAPLILKPNVSVLIIYAHDSAAHDAAVQALAEFMRDVFRIDVHVCCASHAPNQLLVQLDKWDQESIDTSLMDYLSASVLNADKVLVVNSLGAYQRYQAKLAGGQYQIERNEPLPTDQLFLAHIDMALQ